MVHVVTEAIKIHTHYKQAYTSGFVLACRADKFQISTLIVTCSRVKTI